MTVAFSMQAVTRGFFDQTRVVKALSRAKRKAFSKAGAFVRQRARTSMKKKKGSAPPGSPPHAHAGTLRRLLFFSYDERSESVVVGPVLFAAARGPKLGARLLERGGAATAERRGRVRRLFYRPRPYMVPALKAELPKFAGLFKGSLGG